ncbi:MAG TPA: hypothetical protein VFX25_07530 [Streptosporangiaceae bacterium]|nr:hypothetical protein [Streptosporangiaceae bacterium]
MAEKLLLSAVTLSCGTFVEPEPEPPPLELEGALLPQAASTSAALAATAAAAAVFVTEIKETTSLIGGTYAGIRRRGMPHDRSPQRPESPAKTLGRLW